MPKDIVTQNIQVAQYMAKAIKETLGSDGNGNVIFNNITVGQVRLGTNEETNEQIDALPFLRSGSISKINGHTGEPNPRDFLFLKWFETLPIDERYPTMMRILIRSLCEEFDNQEDIAEYMGVTPSTVANFRRKYYGFKKVIPAAGDVEEREAS